MKFLVLFLLCVTSYASNIFEGDMILSTNQAIEHYGSEFVNRYRFYFAGIQKGRRLAGITSSDNPWKEYRENGKYLIPYLYPLRDEDGNTNMLLEEKKATIENAMRHIENLVDYVLFVPKTESHTYWINIGHFTDGCYSYVGLITKLENRGQKLNLASTSTSECVTLGVVSHELLHVLGLYHEQSRFDRDDYVTVNFENVDPSNHKQFAKQTIDTSLGISYDYGSLMHYGSKAFSINDQVTIQSPQPIGQRNGLSDSDALLIKYLYRCPYHDKGAADHCTTSCPCPRGFLANCFNDSDCENGITCQNVTGQEPHITAICGGTRPPTQKPSNQDEGFLDGFLDLYIENIEISIVISVIVATMLFRFVGRLLCSPTVLNEGQHSLTYVKREPAYEKVSQMPNENLDTTMKYII